MIGIYKITSPSGRVYIGQSKDLSRRFREYKKLRCKSQPAVYNSLLKHGHINHTFDVLEKCSYIDLNERERYWQEYYNCIDNGLNCCYVGTTTKKQTMSRESNKAIKKARKNQIPPMLGKKHSKETKNLMSKNHGRGMLGRSGVLNPNYGKPISEEQRKTLSEKGKKRTGKKNGFYGKKHSEATKEKMRISRLGKKWDKDIPHFNSKPRKIILNTDTGVFHFGLKDTAKCYNIKYDTLRKWLTNVYPNKTSLIYV